VARVAGQIDLARGCTLTEDQPGTWRVDLAVAEHDHDIVQLDRRVLDDEHDALVTLAALDRDDIAIDDRRPSASNKAISRMPLSPVPTGAG
jgi:hypothetical protein